MGALSRFWVINIDLSSAQQQYDTVAQWIMDQSKHLVDVVMAHVPGSASSFAGMFVGFRRKR